MEWQLFPSQDYLVVLFHSHWVSLSHSLNISFTSSFSAAMRVAVAHMDRSQQNDSPLLTQTHTNSLNQLPVFVIQQWKQLQMYQFLLVPDPIRGSKEYWATAELHHHANGRAGHHGYLPSKHSHSSELFTWGKNARFSLVSQSRPAE